MNDFTASNGIRIVRRVEHGSSFDVFASTGENMLTNAPWLGSEDMQALREFFQAEADERLGRWRWPENPDYVVFVRERTATPGEKRRVRVIHELDGDFMDTVEGSTLIGAFKDAARAYFDAHPEPKPWRDAKPGEGWVIEVGDGSQENLQAVVVSNDGKFLFRDGGSTSVAASWIRSGRRFHPEMSS